MQAINFALQAVHAHIALGNGLRDGGQIGIGFGQQIAVLLETQARGLFLELKFGNALAQRVQRFFKALPTLITGAQLVGQVFVFAAALGHIFFALHFQVQRILQATLGRGIGQARQLVLCTLLLFGQRLGLLTGRFNGARQLASAGMQSALREGRFLGLALQRAQLLA